MKKIFYLSLFLVLPALLNAQGDATSASISVYEIAFDSAVAKLNQPQLAVYTGREYYPYFIKGESRYGATNATSAGNRSGEHPFLVDEFKIEEIQFEGIVYPAITLTYDICRSEVVVLNPKRKAMVLPEGKVQRFTYSGRLFRSLTDVKDLDADFYEILHWTDSAGVVVKRRKNQNELWRIVSDHYVILNNQAYPVNMVSTKSVGTKAAVLRIFADRKSEIKTFIRQQKLKFSSSDKEQSLIKIVEYYSSLKK